MLELSYDRERDLLTIQLETTPPSYADDLGAAVLGHFSEDGKLVLLDVERAKVRFGNIVNSLPEPGYDGDEEPLVIETKPPTAHKGRRTA
jgi:hypothetical protein